MTIQSSNMQGYSSHIRTHVYEKTAPFLGENEAENLAKTGRIYVRSISGSIYQINQVGYTYSVLSISDNKVSPISIHGGPRSYDNLYTLYSHCIGPVGVPIGLSEINLAIIQVITCYLMIRANERYFVNTANYGSGGMLVSLRGFLNGHGVIE